jgi:uncharacterized Zn finger protein
MEEDYGYLTVTATCPSCGIGTEVRVVGEDGDTKYRTVECTCGTTFGIATAITVSGVVTNYTLS